MDNSHNNVHARNGVYIGGDWVDDIEAIDTHYLCKGQVTSTDVHRRRAQAGAPAGESGVYDVAIIGAGAQGAAVARELAKTAARVVVLEAGDDVTQGATKANSGVIHSGCAARSGSVRAKFAHAGCMMFPQLDRELRFGFNRCGSLFLASGAEEEELLEDLKRRGLRNGVTDLTLVRGLDAVRVLEPEVAPHITAALAAPDAGVVAPYEYCIALCENAADNGVEFRLRAEVEKLVPPGNAEGITEVHVVSWAPGTSATDDDNAYTFSGSRGTVYRGAVRAREVVKSRYVVNCAGLYAADIASRVDPQCALKIAPRHGDYLLLHKNQHKHVRRVLFPCPHPVRGKGVLVNPTLWGNLLIGPTARDVPAQTHAQGRDVPTYEESVAIVKKLAAAAQRLVPAVDPSTTIHTFAGIRAKPAGKEADWCIGFSKQAPSVLNVAGIDSPGLTASPAIAAEVLRLLRKSAGSGSCFDVPHAGFVPTRRPVVMPKADRKRYPAAKGLVGIHGEPLDFSRTSPDPSRRIVCLCEGVTEAEVVATLHRSIPVDSTQGVRRRCRAGMGPCQGRRCEGEVAKIIARELRVPVAEVGRRQFPASSLASVKTARAAPKL
eukprot:TRINITY_DN22394_c0_g1_i1.p1 TRINITY_DN22394_c0_g1~~TRINITY_DN22394_c0_g1_i1.p1  ORF type:complete len:605 (+),score=119.94 TRINITY_DN22394_c0_g1_i1:34-1848(+)